MKKEKNGGNPKHLGLEEEVPRIGLASVVMVPKLIKETQKY